MLDSDPDNNGFINEDFIVWMRTAALPTFRKLYRLIERKSDLHPTLPAGRYSLNITYSILFWLGIQIHRAWKESTPTLYVLCGMLPWALVLGSAVLQKYVWYMWECILKFISSSNVFNLHILGTGVWSILFGKLLKM